MSNNIKILSQVLAIEKSTKAKVTRETTDLHRLSNNQDSFSGFIRQYNPVVDDDFKYPDENKNILNNVSNILEDLNSLYSELFNIVAIKDWTNCKAKADIIVNNEVLVKDVPATYLLFLEKELIKIKTIISDLPELDSNYSWNLDENTQTYKTKGIQTVKTKKVKKPLVLYHATEKHAAQTDIITEDENIGTWETVKTSGAIPIVKKKKILSKIQTLIEAVKIAREQANTIKIEETSTIEKILKYIF